ncbi:MAG: RidA family protein [Alphaproteobacteria bacterium]|nr:RidA family protein [Alphaproteobacteria bacterium]
MSDVDAKLNELGLRLPESAPPLFNYVPYVTTGNMVFVAGQVPIGGPREYKGKVGIDVDMDTAQEAARQCALNILTQIRDSVEGDWSRVVRCVKLGGFVNCGPDFEDQSLVINGASDLMVEALGEEKGKHARFAVGAPSLPAGFAVEIDAVFEIKN